ncbi:augmin complex subunit dgt5 [Anopheles marshallii]|uniref:augmin complex subunit dgt5 n=1 Tax=Anopheles marshallii TaxID=1521116 RepID=UPI00237A8EB4|nr:augmin complex subunit dgt5 [Anopheles marshallii]
MDEIVKFKAWATKLGCPPDKLPPDDALKKSFRGEQSTMFHHIMEKVRSRQEIASMRKNVLVHKLQIHQKTDSIVANASFNTLPAELQRYLKIQKLKKKIDETRLRIKQSIGGFESINLQIKEKNVQKLQLMHKQDELNGKVALYMAHEATLQRNLEKEAQLIQRIERIMPINSCHPDMARKAIERCTQLLEGFYERFQDQNQEASRALQDDLWADLRDVLRGIPNHLLWNVLLTMKDKHLREISEHDSRRNAQENDVTLSDLDLLQASMAKLCSSHICVFLDVVSIRNKVQAAREEYLAKYTPSSNELEAKMALINVMDDEAEEALEEYLVQWNSREYNQGQIDYMTREIERKKQELLAYTQKVQNHEQLLGQLRSIYGQIEEISKHMEAELHQVRQIKQKVHYTKYVCQHTVHTMRQKNGNNQTLNMSDQSFSRLDSTALPGVGGGPVYNPAVLPSLARELEVFRQIPLWKYVCRSKAVLLSMEPNAAIFFEQPNVLALLPCTGVSAEVSLKQFIEIQQLEQHTNASTADSCSVVAPSIEHEQLEHRWKIDDGKICELLDIIETLTNSSQQTMEKVRTYYNFALANNMRKYVPPTKLFNGRNFREYENEYLLYYRMINGFGGDR